MACMRRYCVRMGRWWVRSAVFAGCVVALSCVVWTSAASAASGYYVTFVARDCPSYGDIYANKARNDIVESLQDLGPNSQYLGNGALVSPAYEDLAPQTNCVPLPNWTFTLGTGYVTRAVTGVWGSLSKVTNPYTTSIITKASTPLLDDYGNAVGTQTIPGAVTIKLTDAQASQASHASSLWAEGGTPNDPVLASQFGTPQTGPRGEEDVLDVVPVDVVGRAAHRPEAIVGRATPSTWSLTSRRRRGPS